MAGSGRSLPDCRRSQNDPERSVDLPETRHSIGAKQPFNPNLRPVDDWRFHDLRVSIAPAGVTEPTDDNFRVSSSLT
jgi:hypothetical protein